MGGVYLCAAGPHPHGWHGYVDWFETVDEAAGFLDASLSWLQPSESQPIVALLPMESARLARLADEGRFTELVTVHSLDSIAETWMRYQNTDEHSPTRLRDQWALDLWMNDHWWENEERLRAGILRLVQAARTEDDFGMVSAGPMHDFISVDESRLTWIENQAGGSEPFRHALANVWVWRLPDDAFRRVEQAAGVALADPAPSTELDDSASAEPSP